MQPGNAFFAEMPDSYQLVVNTSQPVVKGIVEKATAALKAEIEPIRKDIKAAEDAIAEAEKDKKENEPQPAAVAEKQKEIADLRARQDEAVKTYASGVPVIRQIIDLALLQSHLLKGESLNSFIRRSVELLNA